MNFVRVDKGSTVYLETLITGANGNGVTGLTVNYQIRKCSDNSLMTSGILTDVGNGVYQSSIIFNTLGQFRVLYISPSGYENGIETLLVSNPSATQSSLDDYGDMIKRILGLSQENYRIINPEFDKHNNLIGGRIKIYETAIDCENDTNALAEYEMDAKYTLKNNRVNFYKMKRIS